MAIQESMVLSTDSISAVVPDCYADVHSDIDCLTCEYEDCVFINKIAAILGLCMQYSFMTKNRKKKCCA